MLVPSPLYRCRWTWWPETHWPHAVKPDYPLLFWLPSFLLLSDHLIHGLQSLLKLHTQNVYLMLKLNLFSYLSVCAFHHSDHSVSDIPYSSCFFFFHTNQKRSDTIPFQPKHVYFLGSLLLKCSLLAYACLFVQCVNFGSVLFSESAIAHIE